MKKEGKKAKAKKGKRLDISMEAVVDNIVFSEKEVWAYYKVSNRAYEFLSFGGKVGLAINMTTAFNNLMTDKTDDLDLHMINTSTPLDYNAWADQIYSERSKQVKPPGFDDFMNEQRDFLIDQNYMVKVSYLGVCLGKRGALDLESLNVFETGFKGAWDFAKKWGSEALALPTGEISKDEEERFRQAEEEIYRILSAGHLQAEKVSSEDILLLMKRQFYPAMPAPDLDIDHDSRLGAGDLDLELYSGIKNRFRWLEITQQIYHITATGYRTTLSFSKFPREMTYPIGIPFLYLPSKLSQHFTTYARFTLISSQSMKKEVEKKQKEQKDELENLAAGQDAFDSTISGGGPADVTEALYDGQVMQQLLTSDKAPWVQGTYRIVIEAHDLDSLKNYASLLKQEYADLGINLNWTSGDQASLFLEQMPGDRLRENSFIQTTNLYQIGASGFNFSSDVGDRIAGRELRK